MIDIRGLFTRDAVVSYLKGLPKIKTPVMDSIFTDRQQCELAVVGTDMLEDVVHELPVIKRGAPAIPASRESGAVSFYEPLAVRPYDMVTAADLNNLKTLGAGSRQAWAKRKTDKLRRGCRKTTEAMCAVSLSGTLAWPVQLESGGYDVYEINYGTVQNVTPAKSWGAGGTKIADVFEVFTEMQEKLQAKGYGSEVEIQAGKIAYQALFAMAEDFKGNAKIRLEISDQGINIGGFLVKRRAEMYRDPSTGTMARALDDKTIRMIAKDAGHRLIYCAVDDLDANLQPMPFFSKPVKLADPSGWKIIGESKPFPAVNVNGICTAKVVE